MKLTVYIVDDEPMAIQYLETLLQGTGLDIEVVGTALNGVKAIPEIAKLHPDFVFVDISMPVMDGLKMSEKVLQSNPLQRIFMLTAYRDFAYAQKGVNIGVTHYFLKNELSEEQLKTVICKNAADLERERREHHQILERNIRDFFREDSRKDKSGWAYQDKPFQRYVLVYITRRPRIVLRHTEDKNQEYIDCYGIESRFHDNKMKLRAFVELFQNEYCGIFFVPQEIANIDWESREIAGHIMNQELENQEDYICLISAPVTKFDMLPNIYYHLRRKVIYLYADSKRIYTEEELSHYGVSQEDSAMSTMLIKWKEKLAGEAQAEAKELLFALLNEKNNNCGVWEYSDKVQDICHFLATQIHRNKLNLGLFKLADTYTDFELLKADLLKYQEIFLAEMRKRREKQFSRHVILAQEYIYRNYMKDISVADIAAAAEISEGHLRRCFKKEINDNVVNYLTDIRLDCGKQLMEEGMKSIEEIWKKIGFTSAQYFSYVFKKREGVSPRDYLRKLNHENMDR